MISRILAPPAETKPRLLRNIITDVQGPSTACIGKHEGTHYFAGAFQGGERENYLRAACHMAAKIDEDESNGITARWHDESHWNRLMINEPPVLILSPSYCCYPDHRCADYTPRISVVAKDAALMRR